MAFACVVPCSTMQIVCDKIDQNEVITFWRILPDWFVPNKSYTVLFSRRVILYLLSLCSTLIIIICLIQYLSRGIQFSRASSKAALTQHKTKTLKHKKKTREITKL